MCIKPSNVKSDSRPKIGLGVNVYKIMQISELVVNTVPFNQLI